MNRTVIGETVRRHLTSIAYLAYVALLAIIAVGMSQIDRPATFWPTLVSLLAIIAGARVIGPEFSSGTLQLILVKPVSRAAYLLSRATGVILCVWIAGAVALGGELAGRAVSGAIPWNALLTAFALTAIDAVLIVSLLALFGSMTSGYTNVEIYVGLQILLMMIVAFSRGKAPVWVSRTITFVQNNLFPDTPSGFDRQWLLLVLSNAALALVLACFAFARREVPYGAD